MVTDHAVSASTVYLIRSIGWVWGVAIISTILQNTLSSGLQEALSGVPDKWKVTSVHSPCLRRLSLLTMLIDIFVFFLLPVRLSTISGIQLLQFTISHPTSRWRLGWCITVVLDIHLQFLQPSDSSLPSQRCFHMGKDCRDLGTKRGNLP